MKKKLSINFEEEIIDKLDNYANEDNFKNKFSIIEFAINKFIRGKDKWN